MGSFSSRVILACPLSTCSHTRYSEDVEENFEEKFYAKRVIGLVFFFFLIGSSRGGLL